VLFDLECERWIGLGGDDAPGLIGEADTFRELVTMPPIGRAGAGLAGRVEVVRGPWPIAPETPL
jgi:hypothetical protein